MTAAVEKAGIANAIAFEYRYRSGTASDQRD